MDSVIDRLHDDEIADALGLLRLLERVGEITAQESQTMRDRVEARGDALRARRLESS